MVDHPLRLLKRPFLFQSCPKCHLWRPFSSIGSLSSSLCVQQFVEHLLVYGLSLSDLNEVAADSDSLLYEYHESYVRYVP